MKQKNHKMQTIFTFKKNLEKEMSKNNSKCWTMLKKGAKNFFQSKNNETAADMDSVCYLYVQSNGDDKHFKSKKSF